MVRLATAATGTRFELALLEGAGDLRAAGEAACSCTSTARPAPTPCGGALATIVGILANEAAVKEQAVTIPALAK